MQYALLIYAIEATDEASPEAIAAEMEAYNEFGRYVADRGAMRGGEALHPSTSATTVRVRDGKTLATDGPFAETKEVLGGFYIVEAADLDDAIGIAARIPGALDGSVEIRPILDFGAESTMRGETVGVGAD
jgi:hypothetical protein